MPLETRGCEGLPSGSLKPKCFEKAQDQRDIGWGHAGCRAHPRQSPEEEPWHLVVAMYSFGLYSGIYNVVLLEFWSGYIGMM